MGITFNLTGSGRPLACESVNKAGQRSTMFDISLDPLIAFSS